jgi:hypothetical protein
VSLLVVFGCGATSQDSAEQAAGESQQETVADLSLHLQEAEDADAVVELVRKLVECDPEAGVEAIRQFDERRRDVAFHVETGLFAVIDWKEDGWICTLLPGTEASPSRSFTMSQGLAVDGECWTSQLDELMCFSDEDQVTFVVRTFRTGPNPHFESSFVGFEAGYPVGKSQSYISEERLRDMIRSQFLTAAHGWETSAVSEDGTVGGGGDGRDQEAKDVASGADSGE